jgi:hypothetical protein
MTAWRWFPAFLFAQRTNPSRSAAGQIRPIGELADSPDSLNLIRDAENDAGNCKGEG